MLEPVARLALLLNVVVPLLLFMAWIYLGLHILAARVVTDRQSPVLWFFSVVTGPLTRPVRLFLSPEAPERRVRAVAFFVYVALWAVVRALLAWLTGGRSS